MICTFGDSTDVVWWRELDLPARSVVQRDGRLQDEVPEWLTTDAGVRGVAGSAGKTTKAARREIADLLSESGEMVGEPRPIEHEVRYYERGERPLEIVTSRQWYIRNGAATSNGARHSLEAGRELEWHPDFMRVPLRALGGGPERRLADQPPAGVRDPVPGLVPARRRRHGPARPPDPRRRGDAPGRSAGGHATGLRGVPTRPARRFRRRSRRHGHVGHLVPHAADRGRMGGRPRALRGGLPDGPPTRRGPRSSGRGCSRRCSAASSSTARCRGPTPASTGGSSTPTARRCRSPRATSSRPRRSCRSTGPTGCATGRAARRRAPTPPPTRRR